MFAFEFLKRRSLVHNFVDWHNTISSFCIVSRTWVHLIIVDDSTLARLISLNSFTRIDAGPLIGKCIRYTLAFSMFSCHPQSHLRLL
jgi:hypothetical protein